MNDEIKYESVVVNFAASDIQATVDFFVRILGFGEYEEMRTPDLAGMWGGDIFILISSRPDGEDRTYPQEVQIFVEEIDKVHDTHRKNGAKIVEEITTMPWGIRRYTIEAPDGYTLVISETVEEWTSPPKSEPDFSNAPSSRP